MPQSRRTSSLQQMASCYRLLIVCWSFVCCLFTAVPTQAATERVWFEDISEPTTVGESHAEQALTQLAAWLPAATEPFQLTADADLAGPQIVFLTIGDGDTPATVYCGSGGSLGQALADATRQIQRRPAAAAPFWLKLDVVDRVQRQRIDFDFQLPWDVTTWGIALTPEPGTEGRVALLAEELIDGGVVTRKLTPSRNRLVDYYRRQGRDPELLRPLFEVTPPEGYLFSTRGFIRSPDGAVTPLYRGRVMRQDCTAEDLRQSLTAAAAYLTEAVGPDGKIEYYWDPATGERLDQYNLVRHAGSLYTMYELYGWLQDPRLWDAAERARGYLLAQLVEQSQGELPGLCAAEDTPEGQVTKLGGTALAAVALAKRAEVSGRTDDHETLRRLGNWIVESQTPQGQFAVHKQVLPDGEKSDFDSVYYPGEAILALTRINRVLPEPRWLESAQLGADWLILVRDAALSTEELPHDHWLLYSLADLYPVEAKPHYLRHAQRLVQAMADQQHDEQQPADWQGGWYAPPRSTPTATRAEALMAAWNMLHEADPATAELALQTARRAVPFQLRTQYRPENSLYLADPARAQGGFRGSLVESWIRNDYVQHSASSILALLLAEEQLSGGPISEQR